MPNDKTALVQRLQAENGFVAYVGDGIRDAVPMKLAQVASFKKCCLKNGFFSQ